MNRLRFSVLIHQDAPISELTDRFLAAEEAGFESAYVCDHANDYRDPGGYWLDGWSVLAAVAGATRRIRIGPLVTNPVLRPPVAVAKIAATLDQVTGGRLDLGVGTGIAGFDHDAAGVDYWEPKERAARFREYVEILDGLLRSAASPFSYSGAHLRTGPTQLVPAPVQQPRPPLVLAGQSPTVRRLAAALGDVWNTHGPFGADLEQILQTTAQQNAQLDQWCRDADRDPASLRRSMLLLGPLAAWHTPEDLARLLERLLEVGIDEVVGCWPSTDAEREHFERFVEAGRGM